MDEVLDASGRDLLVSEVCEALGCDRVSFEESPCAYELLQRALDARRRRRRLDEARHDLKEDVLRKAQARARDAISVLESVAMTPDELQDDPDFDYDVLEVLSEVAARLKLKTCDKASFVLGITALQSEADELQHRIEEERAQEAQIHDIISTEIVPAIASLDELRTELNASREEDDMELRALQKEATTFLPAKISEYEQDVQECKIALSNSGVTNRLTHSELVKLHQQLVEIERKTEPLTERIAGYHNLPPNLALAQQKVDAANEELEELKKAWQEKISTLEFMFDS